MQTVLIVHSSKSLWEITTSEEAGKRLLAIYGERAGYEILSRLCFQTVNGCHLNALFWCHAYKLAKQVFPEVSGSEVPDYISGIRGGV